mgnify:CR=1 FL=1
MLEVSSDAPRFLWPEIRSPSKRILSNTSTAVLRGNISIAPRGFGELVCLDAATGTQIWATNSLTASKNGASINITPQGGGFFLFTDEGNLIRAQLSPAGYREISRAHLIDPTWPFGRKKICLCPSGFCKPSCVRPKRGGGGVRSRWKRIGRIDEISNRIRRVLMGATDVARRFFARGRIYLRLQEQFDIGQHPSFVEITLRRAIKPGIDNPRFVRRCRNPILLEAFGQSVPCIYQWSHLHSRSNPYARIDRRFLPRRPNVGRAGWWRLAPPVACSDPR